MSTTSTSTVVVVPQQVSCELAAGRAILQTESGVYYSLNAAGARVWALLQQPTTVVDLQEKMLAEYDVPAERLEADLITFLHALAAARLVTISHEPAA